MAFVSFPFLLFLCLALVLYYSAPLRCRGHVLVSISLVFYSSWNLWHTLLLVGVSYGVYQAAKNIRGRISGKKIIAAVSILCLLLIVSKSWFYLHDSLKILSQYDSKSVAQFLIPLGLSYYAFKCVGYLLDVLWEEYEPSESFLSFLQFTIFFPQIICGPIQRYGNFKDQEKASKSFDAQKFTNGLRRILLGLFKKVIIADQLERVVALIHANPLDYSTSELCLGALCYTVQLYSDFAGLTDMAIGIGLLFGYRGPENFALPFLASNIQEYWRRWHISLSTWLADYVFMPLRMKFRNFGNVGLSLAIMVNMILIGIWHGFFMNYLIFGIYNGFLMICSTLTLKKRNQFFKDHDMLTIGRKLWAPMLTFASVVFAGILFRADSLYNLKNFILGIVTLGKYQGIACFRLNWIHLENQHWTVLCAMATFVCIEYMQWLVTTPKGENYFIKLPHLIRWGLYYVAIILIAFNLRDSAGFLYAQF